MWREKPAEPTEYLLERMLEQVRRRRRRRQYWLPVALIAAVCVILFHFVLGIGVVSGASMAPNVISSDLVLYDRLGFHIQVGDIVVIESDARIDMIKRVVAVEGDVVSVTADGHLTRNGEAVYEPAVWFGGQDIRGWIRFPLTVPKGSYFCMGDNRPISLDSRSAAIGPVPRSALGGKVLLLVRGSAAMR